MKELSYMWQTAQPLYFTVREKTSKLIANGSGLEQYALAHYSTYPVAAVEDEGSGSYYGDFPTYLADGEYVYNVYLRLGASPAAGDQNIAEISFSRNTSPSAPPVTGLPAAADVRADLEGFNITPSVVSDSWINAQITGYVVPFVENIIRNKLMSEETVTEYYSGNGTGELILNRKPVNSVVEIALVSSVNYVGFLGVNSIEVVPLEGVLKVKAFGSTNNPGYAFFPRGTDNIKVTYKYGFNGSFPTDLFNAITHMASVLVLRRLSAETGGGSLSTPGYTRDYGENGKYTNYRKSLSNQAMAVLKKYVTLTVGA